MKAFQFAPGLDLRVIELDGEPWFVAKDVCDALGYVNTPDALAKHVDDDDRRPINLNTVAKREGIRGNPRASCINESGLYALIMGSKRPEAKAYKRWVTSEVLPSIRKNGGYMAPAVAKLAVESPAEFMARALVMANETIAGLQKAAKGLERCGCSVDIPAKHQAGPGRSTSAIAFSRTDL